MTPSEGEEEEDDDDGASGRSRRVIPASITVARRAATCMQDDEPVRDGVHSSGSILEQLVDHFLERIRRDERPSVAEYGKRHPETAGRIRKIFHRVVRLEHAGPCDGGASGARVRDTPSTTGRDRILGPLRRGGMSTVLLAGDLDLGRFLVLKTP